MCPVPSIASGSVYMLTDHVTRVGREHAISHQRVHHTGRNRPWKNKTVMQVNTWVSYSSGSNSTSAQLWPAQRHWDRKRGHWNPAPTCACGGVLQGTSILSSHSGAFLSLARHPGLLITPFSTNKSFTVCFFTLSHPSILRKWPEASLKFHFTSPEPRINYKHST